MTMTLGQAAKPITAAEISADVTFNMQHERAAESDRHRDRWVGRLDSVGAVWAKAYTPNGYADQKGSQLTFSGGDAVVDTVYSKDGRKVKVELFDSETGITAYVGLLPEALDELETVTLTF